MEAGRRLPRERVAVPLCGDLGNVRGDMYEIAVWEETVVHSGKDIMFAINIPQEAVVIPGEYGCNPRGAQHERLAGEGA